MTIRSSRTYLPLLLVTAAAMLAGCGIKNNPVAPSSQETGASAGADAVAANNASSGFGTAGSASGALRVSRIQDDTAIGPAEVSRNKGATSSGFILDPLLN
ncbi:MAG: hypothetical protein R3184_01255 [Aurantimonas coralicida]|nr:hypothetical protein [Aurantimonas coralicida]